MLLQAIRIHVGEPIKSSFRQIRQELTEKWQFEVATRNETRNPIWQHHVQTRVNDVLHLAPAWIEKNTFRIFDIIFSKRHGNMVSKYREPAAHETSRYPPRQLCHGSLRSQSFV